VSALLEVEDLGVSYGVIDALKGVSLKVEEGQVVALIGANGAGKTTTLRAVSGLVPSRKGSRIRLRGESIAGVKPHLLVARGLAHAPEGRGIFPNLTVEENLALGAYLRRDEGVEADRKRCFELFPVLAQRRAQLAGTLSGGEQQMLSISRALMGKPQLLLLDEPSLGLAPQVVERIFATLREVNQQGVSLLLVEQNANQALRIASRAYVLETGQVVLEGTGEELLRSPEVRRAYLGE